MPDNEETVDTDIDEVYADRNLLAVALAEETDRPAGYRDDDETDARWAVVWIDYPAGEVSFHVPRDLAESSSLKKWGHYGYDGYGDKEKRRRLREEYQLGDSRDR